MAVAIDSSIKSVLGASGLSIDKIVQKSTGAVLWSKVYYKWYAQNPMAYLEKYSGSSLSSTASGYYYQHDTPEDGDKSVSTDLGDMYFVGGDTNTWVIKLTKNVYYQVDSMTATKKYVAAGNTLQLPSPGYTSTNTYYITLA
jgi:hypothetical protein